MPLPDDTRAELEHLGVELVPKDGSRLMVVAGWLLRPLLGDRFVAGYWTTLQLPWWREVRVYYPASVDDPGAARWAWIVRHELVHAWDFRHRGPWVMAGAFLLPVWGRWWIEREAFLGDIRAGRRTPDGAAQEIWSHYGWPWPRRWMREWFEARLAAR